MGDRTDYSGDFRGATIFHGSHVSNTGTQAPAPDVAAVALAAARRLAEMPLDTVPSVTALPARSVMPMAANRLFVGREGDLLVLAKALASGGTAAIGQVAAATGMGGIGKTQLAAEFAHRYGSYFHGGVFWLSFADAAAVPGEIARCGGAEGLRLADDFDVLPQDRQLRMVGAQWRNPLPRLLIYDNCEDEALMDAWKPTTGGCRVLVTSRRTEWSPHLGVQPLPLGVLPREESLNLLRKHRPDLAAGGNDLDAIAGELGDLPLALHLAGSTSTRPTARCA